MYHSIDREVLSISQKDLDGYAVGTSVSSVGSTCRLALSDNEYACFSLTVVADLNCCAAGVLLHGAPRQHESHRCSIGIIMCLIFYCTNKALVYLCLIERACQ